jgi:hypothetical protein
MWAINVSWAINVPPMVYVSRDRRYRTLFFAHIVRSYMGLGGLAAA